MDTGSRVQELKKQVERRLLVGDEAGAQSLINKADVAVAQTALQSITNPTLKPIVNRWLQSLSTSAPQVQTAPQIKVSASADDVDDFFASNEIPLKQGTIPTGSSPKTDPQTKRPQNNTGEQKSALDTSKINQTTVEVVAQASQIVGKVTSSEFVRYYLPSILWLTVGIIGVVLEFLAFAVPRSGISALYGVIFLPLGIGRYLYRNAFLNIRMPWMTSTYYVGYSRGVNYYRQGEGCLDAIGNLIINRLISLCLAPFTYPLHEVIAQGRFLMQARSLWEQGQRLGQRSALWGRGW